MASTMSRSRRSLKPRELGADRLVAAALLPELGRVHDRQRQLDAADGGHLLAQDLLDVQHRLPAEREVGENALGELAYIAGPQEELVSRPTRSRPGASRNVSPNILDIRTATASSSTLLAEASSDRPSSRPAVCPYALRNVLVSANVI